LQEKTKKLALNEVMQPAINSLAEDRGLLPKALLRAADWAAGSARVRIRHLVQNQALA
jgi:hypothetical protein